MQKRKSIRLKDYDYSQAGAYFVTMCVKGGEYVLGDVNKDMMELSEWGKIAEEFWFEIPKHFKNVSLDEFVVMPNHVHGIIWINDHGGRGDACVARTEMKNISGPKLGSIGAILGSYKSAVCRKINFNNQNKRFAWQRNYYERIIRNEQELNNVRTYIQNNPFQWEIDPEMKPNKSEFRTLETSS